MRPRKRSLHSNQCRHAAYQLRRSSCQASVLSRDIRLATLPKSVTQPCKQPIVCLAFHFQHAGDAFSVARPSSKPGGSRGTFSYHSTELLATTLKTTSRAPKAKLGAILQSSYNDLNFSAHMRPVRNGLIDAVIQAYAQHHHLTIHPEDVWFTILTQFSAYVNAHGEELRDHFVAHKGQKELKIIYPSGTRHTLDWSRFALGINTMLEENIVDSTLRDWLIPKFSTTTPNDVVIASIMMMGTLKKYFKYDCGIICGLPSVTLLGEEADWELILKRLDKLETYGTEPAVFASLLRPVIRRLAQSFDDSENPEILDFWREIAVKGNLYRLNEYTGWITAFSFWNSDGKRMYRPIGRGRREKGRLTLDDMQYDAIDIDGIAGAWISAPVHIDDNGQKVEAEMVAGVLGIDCLSHPQIEGLEKTASRLDSMQPLAGWWLYEKECRGRSLI